MTQRINLPARGNNPGKFNKKCLWLTAAIGIPILVVVFLTARMTAGIIASQQKIERVFHDPTCLPKVEKENPCVVGLRHISTTGSQYCSVSTIEDGFPCSSPVWLGDTTCFLGSCVGEKCVFDVGNNEKSCPSIRDAHGKPFEVGTIDGVCHYSYHGPEINAPCDSEEALLQCEDRLPSSGLASALLSSPECPGGQTATFCSYTSPCGHRSHGPFRKTDLDRHVRAIVRDRDLPPEERLWQIERLQEQVVKQRLQELRKQ